MGLDSLPGAVLRLRPKGRSLPPKVGAAALQEVLPSCQSGAAVAQFIWLALPRGAGPVLWVRDRPSLSEHGRLYLPGVLDLNIANPVLQMDLSHPRDVLWAMEEGAACGGLTAVVGEIHGTPTTLSFAATKRLALRAEASGVPVWLIRSSDPGGLSAAKERWRVSPLPSSVNPYDAASPGPPLWEAELLRARDRPPGRWVAVHDPDAPIEANRLRLVPYIGNGPLEDDGAMRSRAVRA